MSQQSKAHSAVHRVAQQIRSIAMAAEPGDYIGSEEKFTRQFGITGPTLRQAIRVLEHEDVIRIKRGVGGGYFAHRPDAKAVSRIAATYLRANLRDFDEISVAIEHIMPLLIDLAIASDRVREFEPYSDPDLQAKTYQEFIVQHSSFTDLLWDVSNNAPLKLLYATCYNVGDGIELQPADEITDAIREVQGLLIGIADAILHQNRESAIADALALVRIVHAGIKDNVRRFGSPFGQPGAKALPEEQTE